MPPENVGISTSSTRAIGGAPPREGGLLVDPAPRVGGPERVRCVVGGVDVEEPQRLRHLGCEEAPVAQDPPATVTGLEALMPDNRAD